VTGSSVRASDPPRWPAGKLTPMIDGSDVKHLRRHRGFAGSPRAGSGSMDRLAHDQPTLGSDAKPYVWERPLARQARAS
jgi:hypothetical protein